MLCKTSSDLIGFRLTLSGLGHTDPVRKQPGVQESSDCESDPACLLGSCCVHSSRSCVAPQELASLQSSNLILSQQLERTQGDLAAQRSRLQEVQQQHMELLEAARQSGHDALTVVVEQYKVSAPSPPHPPHPPPSPVPVPAPLHW